MDICTKYTSMEKLDGSYVLHTDSADIKLYFVTEDIVRVRASFDKKFEEESYVLMTTAWADRLDSVFEGRRTRVAPVTPAVENQENALFFKTSACTLIVEKNPLVLKLLDKDGDELYSSLSGNPFVKDSNNRVTHYSRFEEEDCFYGFGEKAGALNKNKRFIRERATDALSYDPQKMDTLYKHIPFYIRLSRTTQKAVGVFYHNFYESVFNMGCEKSNYWPRYTYWQADGGDIDFFLMAGITMSRILDQYTMLTGRPALLPKRALGYQASSMYYPELEKDSDDAVLNFVDTVKEEGFPIDGFHLSSGYTSYQNKRCGFTWNTERFKDPKAYFAAMNEKGAQNVPNIKPGILTCHPLFEEFVQQDVFVKNSKDPNTYAVDKWWGGPGAFWDYTNPHAREVWKSYLTKSLIDVGTDSIWNDNCEYDSLIDKDTICDFDGKKGTIAQLKPIMSNLMCKIGADAVVEHNAQARPYIVCRSGCAGIQQYAQTWCGDNHTDWDSLRFGVPIITGMGLSGQPNEGTDIGGFAGSAPDKELFVRWVQLGTFLPRFSVHSASNDNTVTEPWMFNEVTDLVRNAMLFRYRLTPYLYSCLYESSKTGAPINRALVYEFQNDPNVYEQNFEFMLGRDLLVATVQEPGATTRKIHLPAGTKWYQWGGHFQEFQGGQTIEIPVSLETVPLFVREGTILPIADNQLMCMQKDVVTDLHLIVVPGCERQFTIYDDDGKTNDYRMGVFHKTNINMSGTDVVTLQFSHEGDYKDTVERVFVEMVHKECSPYWIKLDDAEIPHYLNRRKFDAAEIGWYYSQTNRAVEIKYPNAAHDTTLTVSFEDFDLIGM